MTVQTTSDFHVKQFDGDGGSCDSKNCAAATAAVDIFRATGIRLTADQVRAESGVSCVPGRDTPSGGLRIGDVERVVAKHGGNIDFGWVDGVGYTRWAPSTLALRAAEGWGAHLLIDYGYLRWPWRADTSFTGDHSTYAHDYHASDATYCWHDPLRPTGIRIPAAELIRAWWPSGGPLRGYAGMVRERVPVAISEGGSNVAIRYAAISETGNRLALTKGQALYDKPGGKAVTHLSTSRSVPHVGMAGSAGGKAWRAVVVGTSWSYADRKTHRTVLYVPASAGKVVPA